MHVHLDQRLQELLTPVLQRGAYHVSPPDISCAPRMHMYVMPRVSLHDLHRQFFSFLVTHTDPEKDASVLDLMCVVVLVVFSDPACQQGANYRSRAAADGYCGNGGRKRACRREHSRHRDI